jgi:hypothetical protein
VNVPGAEGPAGTDGADGQNGTSAFTVTTDDFVIPPADGTTPVTVEVADTSWMAVGEPLFMPGGLFFLVDAIIDGTHVSVVSPAWEANVNAGNTITAGAIVTPSGWQPAAPSLPAVDAISAYGVGAAYAITTSSAVVTFGTSGALQITLTTAGTWLLQARARVDYTNSTFAAEQTVTLKLQKVAGTVDVANSQNAFKTAIVTTADHTAMIMAFPAVQYVTAGVTDVIRMMAVIGVDSSADPLTIVEANIIATYLHA